MRTSSGIVELACGWVLAVGVPVRNQVRLLLQFDPLHEISVSGVKDLRLSVDEVRELIAALDGALDRVASLEAALRDGGKCW